MIAEDNEIILLRTYLNYLDKERGGEIDTFCWQICLATTKSHDCFQTFVKTVFRVWKFFEVPGVILWLWSPCFHRLMRRWKGWKRHVKGLGLNLWPQTGALRGWEPALWHWGRGPDDPHGPCTTGTHPEIQGASQRARPKSRQMVSAEQCWENLCVSLYHRPCRACILWVIYGVFRAVG